MNSIDLKVRIAQCIQSFATGSLAKNATRLFDLLGYRSGKTIELTPNSATTFVQNFQQGQIFSREKALLDEWLSVDLLFQLTDEDILAAGKKQMLLFDSGETVDGSRIESYLFFAISLAGETYTRTQLADITREVNRLFRMPVLLLFRHGETLTFAVIDRQIHRLDESRDVLKKVTLIKDIRIQNPHRAHIEILSDLALNSLWASEQFHNFVGLHNAWRKVLDSSALNKRFYSEIANWYFWALPQVEFPAQEGVESEITRATGVIRLLTRLIFTWFIKEKGLVPEALFQEQRLQELLADLSPSATTYYRAVLQNLFFATLNTEMNATDRPRQFRKRRKAESGQDQNYMCHSVYRYEALFRKPDEALEMFAEVPFLNGGLFECLDHEEERNGKKVAVRVDGFSDRPDNPLRVPNVLFFGPKVDVDLNEVFGTTNRRYQVRGLLNILHSYKFTIQENTPIEEEIALDPELLGRVFENLLASYNPETRVTARKQTGSFYTPRAIVNYMVDEALIAALKTRLEAKLPVVGTGGEEELSLDERLRRLFAYTEEQHPFTPAETETLIGVIDDLRILDPACGSGAFPMGILHRLVFLLHKLDPHNTRWKARQIANAERIEFSEARDAAIARIERAFEHNELDYGRKLYLIGQCIYGVDIQPIAIQISKLRFFISLIIDQDADLEAPNLGFEPLPNLETRLVAANSLLGVKKMGQLSLILQDIQEKERDLKRIRELYLTARTPKTKAKYRNQDKQLRAEIRMLLEGEHLPQDAIQLLADWDPYNTNLSAEFFDPEWMFGITEGFDVTIGNPPYVRADGSDAHKEVRKAIEASGIYETLWEKWDLCVPFIERGYKFLRPNGVTTMIVTDGFSHAKYAIKPQNWFLLNSRILRLDFFRDVKIFDAAVHNIIYFFQKADGSKFLPERRLHSNQLFEEVKPLPSDVQSALTHRAFFPEDETTQTITKATVDLETICYISVGMVVHADESQAKGAFTMYDVVSENHDALHCKRFVEGKHLDRWLPSTNKWLEWGTERAPKLFRRPTFPQLHDAREKILVQRSPGPDPKACIDDNQCHFTESSVGFVPWHELANVRNNSLKKVARYLGEKPPRPDLPRREQLEATSKRFATKYLLAVMNSNAARDFLRQHRRSNIHLYPDDWKSLPIPDVLREQQEPIVVLVDQILEAKRIDPRADVSGLEAQIDDLVNELYGIGSAIGSGDSATSFEGSGS